MAGRLKLFIQQIAGRLGYHIQRRDAGVSLEDPMGEQRRLAGDAAMIFEVGAADGRDCLSYRAYFPSAQVHAFEPLPDNFAKLEDKAGTDSNIHAHNLALSDRAGMATFHVAAWDDASSLLPARNTGSTFDAYHESKRSIEVRTETLDGFCEAHGIDRIDLLKMDAQGAELMILRGGARLLERGAISVIYTEVQFQPLYEGAARFDQVMTHLLERGFELHNLYGLHHNQRGEVCWGDAIFVHRNGVASA